jgi:hypothetical protein
MTASLAFRSALVIVSAALGTTALPLVSAVSLMAFAVAGGYVALNAQPATLPDSSALH